MRSRLSIGAILVALFAVSGFGLKLLAEPPCGLWSLNRLRVGMEKATVLSILGEPTEKKESSWVYHSDFRPGWTVLYFDSQHGLERMDAEGAFRGYSLKGE
ncbi:hypothetical protein SH449x_005375 [Pirellulaceae bacterium SH449]